MMGQWSRTVYPAAATSFGSHFRYKHAPPPQPSYYEAPSVNQYEVPYSHMLQKSNGSSGSTNSSSKSSNRSSAKQEHYQVFHLQQQQPQQHFGSQQHLVRYAMQPAPSPSAMTQIPN